MVHLVADVAKTYCFNQADFVEFALKNEIKFGIIIENDKPYVSTWHHDDLVKAFHTMQVQS